MKRTVEVRGKYHVIVRKDGGGYYVAHCVEVPGAVTQGKSMSETLANIREAISLVLECVVEDYRKQNRRILKELRERQKRISEEAKRGSRRQP